MIGVTLRVALFVFAAAGPSTAFAHQLDDECARWVSAASSSGPPDPTEILYASTDVCTECEGSFSCLQTSKVMPCWSNYTQTFGHRDLFAGGDSTDVSASFTDCRIVVNGTESWETSTATFRPEMYIPIRGPKWQQWKWVSVSAGDPIPAHAVRFGDVLLGRTLKDHSPTYDCGNIGDAPNMGFSGYVETAGSLTKNLKVTTNRQAFSVENYDVAVCDASTTTAAPAATASPTLPPNNKPYIRFGNTIPTGNLIEAVITQGSVSYSWKSYKFGQFSEWNELFSVGPGTIAFYSVSAGGARGALQMQVTTLLTPGPLVVVAKGSWPPSDSLTSWETIAASYVPKPYGESGVRLFNLIADTKLELSLNASTSGMLAQGVNYTTGSKWAAVPQSVSQTFTVYNSETQAVLTTLQTTPPPHPFVCTIFVVGTNVTGASYGPRGVVLSDAPEH